MELPLPPLTVDEVVARMRTELNDGDGACAHSWRDVQDNLSNAQQNADIGGEPPLRPWHGALRPLARLTARAVLFLSRFITDAQIRFNVSVLSALTTLVAGARRLETASTTQAAQIDGRLRDLEHALSRLQVDLARVDQRASGSVAPQATAADGDSAALDDLYVALEDRFRGSRDEITARLRAYLPLLDAAAIRADEHLIDLGCGRGEWLELLHERGWRGLGIDTNGTMIGRCRALALDVMHADAITFLRSLPAASTALVSAFHLAEHLPFPALAALFGEATRVLRHDGLLLIETPNPQDLTTATYDFFLDPTHRHPLPPALLTFLAETNGLDRITIVVAEQDRARHDYALIARKP